MFTFSRNLFLLTIFLSVGVFAADTITGTAHNLTTGKPAAGDDVVLLRLGQGMQEESRTKTDAEGKFTLNVASPNDQHLIQVSHQGVNYDQGVNGSGPVDVGVYDVVANIPGLSGTVGVAQLESDGKVLKVTEMYEITNKSNPPVTQARPDNFGIILPPKAVLESAKARREQGMWLNVKPDPVQGQGGGYKINFPIRPGRTQLTLAYHMPYSGSATLHLKVPYPIERFGILHPSSMTFKPAQPDAFRSAPMSPQLQGEVSQTMPVVRDVPVFQVSGTGRAALHGSEGTPAPPPMASAPPPVASAPPAGAHPAPAPASTPSPADQSRKELWLMIGGIVLILAIGGFTLWKMNRPAPARVASGSTSGKPLLEALKEQLFQLESDRLHGAISAEEYATNKQALNKSIERAMGKQ